MFRGAPGGFRETAPGTGFGPESHTHAPSHAPSPVALGSAARPAELPHFRATATSVQQPHPESQAFSQASPLVLIPLYHPYLAGYSMAAAQG